MRLSHTLTRFRQLWLQLRKLTLMISIGCAHQQEDFFITLHGPLGMAEGIIPLGTGDEIEYLERPYLALK